MLWLSDVPLGVPGEWTWPRIRLHAASVWGWIVAAAAAAVYIAFIAVGECGSNRAVVLDLHRLGDGAGGRRIRVARSGPVVGPGNRRPDEDALRALLPSLVRLLLQARYKVHDTREFLAGYEDLLAERDYLHIGTHPPGLTLLFRGLLGLFAAAPGLTDVILATEPDLVATRRRRSARTS